jgi:DNA polymerase-3 subunit alpha/error-prone DNA polymerase
VYANIAWETAWLKANYPAQFYCSLFNNHQGMYPLRVYVADARRHGLEILPPHVNAGEIEWSVQGHAIRAGFRIVKGLSAVTARAIVEQRLRGTFRDIDDLRRRVRFRKPELQNLIHVGACDGLGATRPAMLNRLHCAGPTHDQPTLFDLHWDRSVEALPDYDGVARLQAELDVTGIPFSMHPAALLGKQYVRADRLHEFLGKRVVVAGFIATARRARTSDNRVMGFVTLEDATGLVETSFFPDKLGLYKTIRTSGGPVWISGRVVEHLSCLSLDGSDAGRIS